MHSKAVADATIAGAACYSDSVSDEAHFLKQCSVNETLNAGHYGLHLKEKDDYICDKCCIHLQMDVCRSASADASWHCFLFIKPRRASHDPTLCTYIR